MIAEKPLLSRLAASEYLMRRHGIVVSPAALATRRSRGGGPTFYSGLGQRVYYRPDDLDRWVEQHRIEVLQHNVQQGAE